MYHAEQNKNQTPFRESKHLQLQRSRPQGVHFLVLSARHGVCKQKGGKRTQQERDDKVKGRGWGGADWREALCFSAESTTTVGLGGVTLAAELSTPPQ